MSGAPADEHTTGWLAWLRQHADALEPGLRLGEPAPRLDLPLAPTACGPDPLGRPCFLFHFEQMPVPALAETLLEIAARLREARPALEAWYARPAEPRLFLLAPDYPLALRNRLALLGAGLGLQAWSYGVAATASEAPALRLEIPAPSRHPVAALPPTPPSVLQRLRRLLLHAERIQPPLAIHGGAWPLHLAARDGAIGVLHRDGDEILFVGRMPAGRAQVLRLDDEESVDRALDALLRSQFTRALGA
jgi:hypothetical protein